jgi:NADPH-dependent 2,4-dienoyl-CoA reductase/sulfur reductase-like enzyme
MTAAGHVVIVGGSLGGLRAAEQLRAAGWSGEITVVGEERHPPYNRPPLSKQLLAGTADARSLALRPRPSVSDVRWRLAVRAVRARLADRVVTLAGGERLRFDGLVVATGLRPRRLGCPGPERGRYRIRTLDDAQRLRAALTRPGVRVVVVGAGFIGCEVAATAIGRGAAEVTVVSAERLPMLRPLGELLAAELLRRHRDRGVRFALKRTVVRFEGDDRVAGVVLDDGTRLPADVVVEAVGSVANTEWLAGNRLDLSDGVLCDEHLRVVGWRNVVAVGDVARFPNARYDRVPRRVGHWSTPVDTAKHAARALVAGLTGVEVGWAPFAPLPSYWSDQYEFRLQSFGAPARGSGEVRVLAGELAGEVVVGYHAAGRLVGVVAVGGPGATAAAARYRPALLAI